MCRHRVDGKLVSGGFPSKTVYATGPNNGGTMEMPGSLALCAYVVVWLVSFWLGLSSARLVTL